MVINKMHNGFCIHFHFSFSYGNKPKSLTSSLSVSANLHLQNVQRGSEVWLKTIKIKAVSVRVKQNSQLTASRRTLKR